jgi:superfamily II DNA or RNA helicase
MPVAAMSVTAATTKSMKGSILSINGYGITKKDNETLITELKDELTMMPNQGFSMGAASDAKLFTIWTEGEKRLYLPRYYALQKFGIPEKCTLTEGELREGMEFQGTLREQQLEPVHNFIQAATDPLRRGGIISVPCGFGKTIMSVYVACHFKRKTMFVSHKDFLNQQFLETVKTFVPNAKIGIIKQSKVDVEDKDFVIASLQSLAMRDYDLNIFKQFGLVIIDEVHHLGAEVFSRAFMKLNVNMILGLSATLNRKDGMRKVFEHYIGKSVYKYAKKEKTTVDVEIHKYFDPNVAYSEPRLLWNGKPNSAAMINNICSFAPRTNYVISVLTRVLATEADRKVLILSERRQHLADIEKLVIETLKLSVGYYVGGLSQAALDESAQKQIILATYQMAAEGMNIPTLNTVIFASPISDIQQSIGRILREKPSERKYIPLCIDILDEFSIFTRKGYARLKYYKTNDYDIRYFLDNEAIPVSSDVAAADTDNSNNAQTKKKYEFIPDE